MKQKIQKFQCNSVQCKNETKHKMPSVEWLQIEIIICSNCGQMIAFSTLYPPKRFIGKSVKLP